MLKKSTQFLFGLRVIFTWLTVISIGISAFVVIKELSIKATTQEVILGEECPSPDPRTDSAFKAKIGNGEWTVYVSPDKHTGDTAQVILRDGNYYKPVYNDSDIFNYVNPTGRAIRVLTNGDMGMLWFAPIVFIPLLILTFRQGLKVRDHFPIITLATHIGGILFGIPSVFLWTKAWGLNTWDGLEYFAYSVLIMIAYLLIFTIVWAIDVATHNVT